MAAETREVFRITNQGATELEAYRRREDYGDPDIVLRVRDNAHVVLTNDEARALYEWLGCNTFGYSNND